MNAEERGRAHREAVAAVHHRSEIDRIERRISYLRLVPEDAATLEHLERRLAQLRAGAE